MKKSLILLLLLMLTGTFAYAAVGKETKGPFGYNLWEDINRPAEGTKEQAKVQSSKENSAQKSINQKYLETTKAKDSKDAGASVWEKDVIYYPNASLKSAVQKYKNGNFSGSLQELISLTKIDEGNPIVYYYLGMAYTQVGDSDSAVKAYEKVINLSSDKTIVQYAIKGKDCLTNGPTCESKEAKVVDELDAFINAPYGNGFSDSLNKEIREKELKNIQNTINKKDNLDDRDMERIYDYDNNKSELEDNIKIAEASDEDILNAIKTLKEAGVNVSISPAQNMVPNQYNDISMMLGTSNNNNNNMMNMMIPYMMSQNENGKNIDPQVMQAMMMNSMIPDFTFSDNDKRY